MNDNEGLIKIPSMSNTVPKLHEAPEERSPLRPWDKDKLKRKQHAEILTKYILGIEVPYVIAVNGGWGTGKTTFLRMWRDDLVHQNPRRHCILFDAWKTDYHEDPLVALMGAISDYVDNLADESDTLLKKAVKGALSFGWAFVKSSPKHLGKMGLKYLLNKGLDVAQWTKEAKEATQETDDDKWQDDLASTLAETAADMYSEYLTKHNAIDGFKKQLATIAKELEVNNLPLIIMVDELDRCRPNYALLALERIKHLFNINGVVFVLGLEHNSLARTVDRLYGLGTCSAEHPVSDSQRYLRRFIDLEYNLPDPNHFAFAEFLFEKFQMPKVDDPLLKYCEYQDLLVRLKLAFELSLRDMAQVAAQTAMIARSYNTTWLQTCTVMLFIVLRMQDPELYAELTNEGGITYEAMDRKRSRAAQSKRLRILKDPANIFAEVVFNRLGFNVEGFNQYISKLEASLASGHDMSTEKPIQRKLSFARAISDKDLDNKDIYEMIEFTKDITTTPTLDEGLPRTELEDISMEID